MICSFALITLINDFDSVSAQLYFQSAEARVKDSPIRKVGESGLVGLGNLESSQVAKLVFASILLSDSRAIQGGLDDSSRKGSENR
jgi:hypothetical protein